VEQDILTKAKQQSIGRLREHSFLRRCRSGEISLEELKIYLVQQGFYSAYFTRYLCAVMAGLPGHREVTALSTNLFEELGLTPDSDKPHHLIYSEMLADFSISLEEHQPTYGTRHLIDTMFRCCRSTDPASGLGALFLGAEALVPDLYGDIIKGFEYCGIAADSIEFFHIHTLCDDAHSKTLHDILREMARRDSASVPVMIGAGMALVDARLHFFSAIEAQHAGHPHF